MLGIVAFRIHTLSLSVGQLLVKSCTCRRSCKLLLSACCASCRALPLDQRPLVQKIAVAYWMFHYAKRIFETYFVHT